ncbi:MAG TPA: YgaP-like transmembrane domain [Longimicrobiales bacterium]|nr:YgaP-like transmembrane domain [Longimicrobiales bacterium]
MNDERGWDTIVNVGDVERLASLAGGGWFALTGLFRSGLVGLLKVGLGGYLLYRGTTGYCAVYEAAGLDTAGGGDDWDWDDDWDGDDLTEPGPVAGRIGEDAAAAPENGKEPVAATAVADEAAADEATADAD